MKNTYSASPDTLVQLLKANSEKRNWAESLLKIVRSAKNSRGENRNRELARLESEILDALIVDNHYPQLESQILDVNRDFVAEMTRQHPKLTENELLLSCFFRMELPVDTIAFLKGISQASLNVSRSRLKNKLGIIGGKNLDAYLQQL